MFSFPARPVREFSLAELLAKINELAERQPGNRHGDDGEARASRREAAGDNPPAVEQELSE